MCLCDLNCLPATIRLKLNRLCFLLVMICCSGTSAPATADATLETKIKVAYLYNFLRFVEWPLPADSAFRLCIAGAKKEYHKPLQVLSSRTVRTQQIIITYLEINNGADLTQSLQQCHLVFITNLMQDQQDRIINTIANAEILTIGENEDFIHQGGMINFIQQQNKIRFEVNLHAINQTQLQISSKVLRIATRVIE